MRCENIIRSCNTNCFFGCRSNHNAYDESREIIPNPEGYKKDTFYQSSNDTIQLSETNKAFPFAASQTSNKFTITAQIKGVGLFPRYDNFFKKLGYNGDGRCWEGHIKQILEEKDRNLLNRLSFNSEADRFYVYAGTKEDQEKFIHLLSPIFSDLSILSAWVLKANRSTMGDPLSETKYPVKVSSKEVD